MKNERTYGGRNDDRTYSHNSHRKNDRYEKNNRRDGFDKKDRRGSFDRHDKKETALTDKTEMITDIAFLTKIITQINTEMRIKKRNQPSQSVKPRNL